jgi:threonine/homoserine/homoserine lactone efflux protein
VTFSELLFASLPFLWFMLVCSITPGPNNIMLAASGMNFGIRRTMPHIAGISFGFFALMLMCTFGVGAIYAAYPPAHIALNIFCAAYILYLSYKIATAGKPDPADVNSIKRPMNFFEGAMFQFVNPKGWVAALASTASLLPAAATLVQKSFVILLMTIVIGLPSLLIWALFGKAMARIFTSEKSHHIINIVLALLLAATIPLMMI